MGFLQISREDYSTWGFFRSPGRITPYGVSSDLPRRDIAVNGEQAREGYCCDPNICGLTRCFVSVPSQRLWFKSLFSTFGLLIVFAGWVDCVLVGGIVNHSSLIPALLIQADLRTSHVAHDWSHTDTLRGIPTTVYELNTRKATPWFHKSVRNTWGFGYWRLWQLSQYLISYVVTTRHSATKHIWRRKARTQL
jgi:hypothetical protein